ncbi:heptaprenylglyceryl phosphate synthase [Paenibacillus aurantius]|uniref:Heptaprenylglyceryl phosphate synthase n=1 Tax=Paenibacillus aurantius TaxID=2918900 RepID=A0AA96LGH3_9BACL|nr:heptaprenylglyceryl phosphate synthase [Paenibacillus aurantius]WNQ11645.1 heptaprenylglyceryl phosphate synthase [Paenibacillus aurantius]
MNLNISAWKHVFKLDPDRSLDESALERLCLSGTDAIMVGGSSGVTYDNTVDLMSRIRRFEVACVQEISTDEAVVPGFDLYFIPSVLNTEQGRWITGRHHQALKDYGALLDWSRVVPEGYVILNPDSTAARLTGAQELEEPEDLKAYARLADKLFRLPVFYVEYSGAFGNMEWVRQAKHVLEEARLFYGGGISSEEQARQAAEAAHTIVVGNIIYEDLERALSTVLK